MNSNKNILELGHQFESQMIIELNEILGVENLEITPHHPQTNGMIVRWHRSLKEFQKMMSTIRPGTTTYHANANELRLNLMKNLTLSQEAQCFVDDYCSASQRQREPYSMQQNQLGIFINRNLKILTEKYTSSQNS